MVELILIEITAVPAERSRGKHHPRVVKRKMSSFPTKSRAAPAARHRFRYDEHIRIVAPAGLPKPNIPPSATPPIDMTPTEKPRRRPGNTSAPVSRAPPTAIATT
jgi:hypothetical protein